MGGPSNNRDRDAHSWVPQVEEEISTVDEIDVAVVIVRPCVRPRIDDFKVVAAVGEMRPASDESDVADGEMMVVAEMRPEMSVVDSAHFLSMLDVLIVPLFLAGVVVVIVLRKRSQRASQQECPTDADNYDKSIHDRSLTVLFEIHLFRIYDFVADTAVTVGRFF